MSNVRIHKLGLNKDDNPNYYDIVDKHNDLMKGWNRLNKDFNDWKQPKLFLFCEKGHIRSYYKPISDLQTKYLDWNKLATNFLYKPNFIFSEGFNKDIGFIHYLNILTDMKNHLSNNMVLLINNFVKIQERYKSKINFIIAIFSATISTIGLGIALWTILK